MACSEIEPCSIQINTHTVTVLVKLAAYLSKEYLHFLYLQFGGRTSKLFQSIGYMLELETDNIQLQLLCDDCCKFHGCPPALAEGGSAQANSMALFQ
jgi:hypothetical protein